MLTIQTSHKLFFFQHIIFSRKFSLTLFESWSHLATNLFFVCAISLTILVALVKSLVQQHGSKSFLKDFASWKIKKKKSYFFPSVWQILFLPISYHTNRFKTYTIFMLLIFVFWEHIQAKTLPVVIVLVNIKFWCLTTL